MKNINIPTHIAIIMDGNRRWARDRGLPVLAGHRHVTDKILEPLVERAAKQGIKYLTFWAWSTENWERDKQEVTGIMKLFKHVIHRRWRKLHEKGVRVKFIGDISRFDPVIKNALEKVITETKNNKTITVIFALNYGGRDEIIRAFNKYLSNLSHLSNLQLNQKDFSKYLDTSGIPDPDLIVRTGGEQRLSGFLLWQSEYAELMFPNWYMPEFTTEKLDEILEEFAKRQRRYGK